MVEEPGYLYVYLSNESETPSEVYFDDFTVSVSESRIVQLLDYYPYGMVANSWVRSGGKATRDLFQGKPYEEVVALSHFGARQYDASLGRWQGVDPANQFASPYTGMGNSPVMGVDPDGRIFFAPILVGAAIGGVVNLGVKALQGKIGSGRDALVAFGIGAASGALTAATGGAAAGALGLSTATVAGGAVAGAGGAVVGSPVQGLLNMAYFGDSYSGKQFGIDILMGGVLGGVAGGVAGWLKNVKGGGNRGDIWGIKDIIRGKSYSGTLGDEGAGAIFDDVIREERNAAGKLVKRVYQGGNHVISTSQGGEYIDGVRSVVMPFNPFRQVDMFLSPRQALHYGSTATPGKSILTEDPSNLLKQVNQGNYTVAGTRGDKILVNFGRDIGNYLKDGSLVGPTRFGLVHISVRDGMHIIPANPVQW